MEAALRTEPPAMEPGQSTHVLGFADELRDNVFHHPDERVRTFSSAVLAELQSDPGFSAVVRGFLVARPEIEQPSLLANILLRSFQKQLLKRELRDAHQYPYPGPYDSVLPWRKVLRGMSSPDNPHYPELLSDLHNRTPQSNIVERYKSFSLILQLMRGRFGRKPNVLDVGCSQNHGLKRLAFVPNEHMPTPEFNTVQVVGPGDRDTKRMKASILNNMLSYSSGIGGSIGVDIEPIDNPDNKEWAKACSFYPSELLDVKNVAEYDFLEMFDPDSVDVGFYQADFASLDTRDFTRQTGYDKFDMVIFPTVLNQVAPADRLRMFDNARALVKPAGLIVVQDFAHVDPKDGRNLQFYPNWFARPYRYRTIIADAASDFTRFHEVMRWDNGRCNKVQLTHAIGTLALAETLRLLS